MSTKPTDANKPKEVWKDTTTVMGATVTLRLMYKDSYYLSIAGKKGDCEGAMNFPVKGNGEVSGRMVVCRIGIHGKAHLSEWREEGPLISFKMDCYWGTDHTPWFHLGTYRPHGSRATTATDGQTAELEFLLGALSPEVPAAAANA